MPVTRTRARHLAYTCGSMSANDPREPTERIADFGYEQVPWDEKKARVRGVVHRGAWPKQMPQIGELFDPKK